MNRHDTAKENHEVAFPIEQCRAQFPALRQLTRGRPTVFFDGPAGSQTPRRVIDAMADYLGNTNANHGGVFATSRASDAMLDEAHAAMADFVGSGDAATTIFGPNMTTLTFAFSRALARTWGPGDEVLVTRLEHDANVTPWVLAARDAGATVRHVSVRTEDCTLDLDDLRAKLSPRTRLVAVGAASNAVGTINPIEQITAWAHEAGAEVFVDAVHLAPHRALDAAAWGCDYLVCSVYKFFGPHVGVLWGRRERLEALEAYKLRAAPEELPRKWMTGTQNHEGIAGALAAVEYLADLGRAVSGGSAPRRRALVQAFTAITAYETRLCERLLAGLDEIPGLRVWGITDRRRLAERAPTLALRHEGLAPRQLAERLADEGIFVWHGNFYALPLTEALGLEPEGVVRVGLLHYNTAEEVERLLEVLRTIAR